MHKILLNLKKSKKSSRPRILCDVRGHSRHLLFSFHLSFSQCLFVFCRWCFCVSVLHEERGTCFETCFEIDSHINTHLSVYACERVCNQKMYTNTYIYSHTHTHLEFRGNTSILSSTSSKVGLFLPHLLVTWLLSANQGFLNQALPPQDVFKGLCFLKAAALC